MTTDLDLYGGGGATINWPQSYGRVLRVMGAPAGVEAKTMGSSGNLAASRECANSQKAQFAAESLGFGGTSATTTGNFAADFLQMQQTKRRHPTDGCGASPAACGAF
jgi:hypothetical protein